MCYIQYTLCLLADAYWAFIVIVKILQHLLHIKDGIEVTSSSPLDYFLSSILMLVSLSHGNTGVHLEISAILQKCLVSAVTLVSLLFYFSEDKNQTQLPI